MISNNQKPCLVQTSQGFSVSYNDKLLYSKYNPSKLILNTINNLQILPDTIVLCFSPVLTYGLKELSEKLPENCILFGCELNNELREFIFENKDNYSTIKDFTLLTYEELINLGPILTKKTYTFNNGKTIQLAGNYKRVIKIDFSAGIQFESELYNQLYSSCVHSIKTFWTNRLTITTFGRRYAQDLFKNLNYLSNTTDINSFIKKINQPIICFGAGQSANKGIEEIKQSKENYFILCADTVMSSLISNEIIPDGVFVEEAQFIINKAFIGLKKYSTQFFTSLSSTPQIKNYIKQKNISYFTTEFADTEFINNLKTKDFLPTVNPPFGSVGLTMVYYALQFRKDSSIPIYCYGLDFSYSSGITHAKQTMAHKERLINTNKITPIQNYNAAFNNNTIKLLDKQNNIFFSTPALQNYAYLFNGLFQNEINLFDSGESGISLNIQSKSPVSESKRKNLIVKEKIPQSKIDNLNSFIINEKKELEELKDILTGKIKLTDNERTSKIHQLLCNKDYLYFHFPDGFRFELNQSFLNRIRTEIDFYLKIIK